MTYLSSDVLWLTVLERAVLDYIEGPDEQEVQDYVFRVRDDARAWISSSSRDPGSFLWVCDRVGVDPKRIRAKIQAKRVRIAPPLEEVL